MTARPGGALADELRGEVRGDVWFDRATRAIYATDASNYRQVPLAVVCPRDAGDVAAVLRVAAAHDVPVTPRGAGTSLAGQAVNVGVILDTSRHMRSILEVDAERGIARVQPGVVLDDLRRETEKLGLTFGPDPATHAWCTVGGMLGNDSCGTHALVAGRTGDNVERLRVVTYGGETMDVGAYPDGLGDGTGPLGERLAALGRLVERYDQDIRTGFPALDRRVSGIALDRLLPGQGVRVARSLVGTEGTCAVVTEATLRLVHIPAHRRLVVLGYRDVFEAAEAVPGLLAHPLQGLEGIDQTLVDHMRARPLNVEHLPLLPEGRAWLFAELAGDTPAEADEAAHAFTVAMSAGQVWRRFDDPGDQARLWLIRESGLGATAIRADGVHNREGWEDAAVPPARLAEYLRGLTALWREFGYSGALYGHFGQGCVHTRNDFDLHTTEGRARYRAFVERAADLVVSLGGSLSGEHGDGQARGELLSRMYGPGLMDAFRAYKAVWDPRGRMNPGKLVDPRPLDQDLRYGAAWRVSTLAAQRPGGFALARDHGSLQAAAERCVGVGRCRRDDHDVMCPSYRATRLEEHSTRGRAKLLAELFQGDATPETWRNPDVREALDLCLSCKGCKLDCPTGVDVATYKAEFLHHHYRRRLRPRAAYIMGTVPLTARIATRMPRLVNGVLRAPGLGRAALKLGGITTARPPIRFASRSFRRSDVARDPGRRDRTDATVVVWPDSFTDAFDPELGGDVVALLEASGERVAIPSGWGCCGRPLYDSGMLGVARGWLRRLVDVLDPWTSRGIPVVVPEPSCLSAFRDELPNLLADDPRAARLAQLARSPAEHLLADGGVDRLLDGRPSPGGGRRLMIHPHCQGRAVRATDADAELARRLGFEVSMVDGGCCGLAGSFGFRAEHEAVSRTIGTEQWLPAVEAAIGQGTGATLVIDGFSCRTQLEHLGDRTALTLAGVIRGSLGGASAS